MGQSGPSLGKTNGRPEGIAQKEDRQSKASAHPGRPGRVDGALAHAGSTTERHGPKPPA